jgi:hypothetical protein
VESKFHQGAIVGYLAAALAGCWIITATTASVEMTGRFAPPILKAFLGAVLALAVVSACLRVFVSDAAQVQFYRILLGSVGVACCAVAGWALLAALRHELIDAATTIGAFAVWGALSLGILAFASQTTAGETFLPVIVWMGVAGLIVAPLGTAPLALALNRTR